MNYIIGHNTETSHLSQEEYAQRHNQVSCGVLNPEKLKTAYKNHKPDFFERHDNSRQLHLLVMEVIRMDHLHIIVCSKRQLDHPRIQSFGRMKTPLHFQF